MEYPHTDTSGLLSGVDRKELAKCRIKQLAGWIDEFAFCGIDNNPATLEQLQKIEKILSDAVIAIDDIGHE